MEGENRIKNFVIISHIDHGKSTLADRFLELTNTIAKEKMRAQYLDMMDLEREKGITIKMQPVRMLYEHPQNQKSKLPPSLPPSLKLWRTSKNQKENKEFYILNLIDTPGHVDFSYEVSRALAAVEGAVLLVDATKGIQSQTIANLELAKKQGLVIIPVVNKIDSTLAQVDETSQELADFLEIEKDEISKISAKYGTNVKQLLETIIEKIPSPQQEVEKPLKALIFDSKYDIYQGVIAYVRIMQGKIGANEKIYLIQDKTEAKTKEVGYFNPEMVAQKQIIAGEIGYIATGIKEPGRVRVGDTITKLKIKNEKLKIINVEPLPGYQEPKPMVFASFYPADPNDHDLLKESLAKLKLNDASLTFEPETKEGLGRGFRCGFLGNLHAEITSERLYREFNLNLIISAPQVLYKVINQKNQEISICSASDWFAPSEIKEAKEPWLKLEIIAPRIFLGRLIEIVQDFEVKQLETKYFGQDKVLLICQAPLRTIISGFYDKLKGVSQGFASMNYKILGWENADLVKLEILVAGKKEEAFSKIVPKAKVYQEGKKIVEKLKLVLPPHLFSIPLQAAVSGKIIARETIRAKGKDVIAPLYGGDYTRKRKLLEKQKKGKKELKEKGEVRIPPKVFFEIFRS